MTIKHLGGVFGRNPTFNDVTIEGTLTFEGNIDIDSDITWEDNKKAIFGDDGDLQIYHDGSHSIIKDAGTGDLQLWGNVIRIKNAAGTENAASFLQDGAVVLNYDNSQKFTTSSTGVDISGNLEIDGGTSTTVFINSSTHNAGIANDATLQFGFGHSGSPDAVGSIKLVENTTNSFDGNMVFSVPSNNGSGGSSTAEAMRIDYSGSVILNNTGSGNGLLKINGATGSTEAVIFQRGGTEASRIGHSNSADLTFSTGSGVTERMRIDSSGNLLVGTSVTPNTLLGASATQGVAVNGSSGYLVAAASGQATAYFNRQTSDGTIADFRKDGTTVGSIGAAVGNAYYAGTATGITFGSANLYPTNASGTKSDGALDLGASANRFKDLYLSGVVNSDGIVHEGDADTYIKFLDNRIYSDVGGNRLLDLQPSSSVFASDGSVQFKTGASLTERMRVDSSGNLLVGRSSAGAAATDNGHVFYGTGQHYIFSNATQCVRFYETSGSGQQVGSISITSSATTFNTSSDQRLKDNIVDAPSASDDIDAIQVRSFDWKADGSHQKYGMVAQELQSVAPEAVTGDADSDEMMGVDYSKLVPMLVKEIQTLRARVAQLEGEN